MLQAANLDEPVCRDVQQRDERATNRVLGQPFPRRPSISKNEFMSYLERLIKLVRLEERLAK